MEFVYGVLVLDSEPLGKTVASRCPFNNAFATLHKAQAYRHKVLDQTQLSPDEIVIVELRIVPNS